MVQAGSDVTSQKRQADEVSWRATHDPLTHALNRSAMISAIAEAILSARRHGQQHALMYIDLDDFKYVNDRYGHSVGDDMLVGIYRMMEGCVLKGDRIARMGGDEPVRCGGISIGISIIDADTHDWKHALKLTDQACYSAKRAGKNRVRVA